MQAWLWRVAVRKATTMAAKVATGFAAAHLTEPAINAALVQIQPFLANLGITFQIAVQVDPTKLEAGLGILFVTGLEVVHDWAKLKWPEKIKF